VFFFERQISPTVQVEKSLNHTKPEKNIKNKLWFCSSLSFWWKGWERETKVLLTKQVHFEQLSIHKRNNNEDKKACCHVIVIGGIKSCSLTLLNKKKGCE
jgi:hypothetical protein